MLFNSFQFLFFFLIVYTLYLFLKHRGQNRLLIVVSCLFYGAWNVKFLALMFVSITTDYFCAQYIHRSQDQKVRRRFLVLAFL